MAVDRCPRIVRPVASPQLQQLVEASKKSRDVFFIKFASAFCGACQESKKALDAAMKTSRGCHNVVELDSDINASTADSFGVKALPTLVAVKHGQVIGKMEGARDPAAYVKFFEKHSS